MSCHDDVTRSHRSPIRNDTGRLPVDCSTLLEDVGSMACNGLSKTGHILRRMELGLIVKLHCGAYLERQTRFTH
jgi:hypothetical protein